MHLITITILILVPPSDIAAISTSTVMIAVLVPVVSVVAIIVIGIVLITGNVLHWILLVSL